jgi:hypothetical protein
MYRTLRLSQPKDQSQQFGNIAEVLRVFSAESVTNGDARQRKHTAHEDDAGDDDADGSTALIDGSALDLREIWRSTDVAIPEGAYDNLTMIRPPVSRLCRLTACGSRFVPSVINACFARRRATDIDDGGWKLPSSDGE